MRVQEVGPAIFRRMAAIPRLTPRKEPRQDRSRALVADLLEGTRRVLVSKGYEDTVMAEIAEVTGVSVGSVYQYFPSKESLLTALHVSLLEGDVTHLADNLMEHRDTDLEGLAAVIAAVALESFHAHHDVLHTLEDAAHVMGSERKLAPVRAQGVQLLTGFLESHVGYRGEEPDLTAHVVQRLMASMPRVLTECGEAELAHSRLTALVHTALLD